MNTHTRLCVLALMELIALASLVQHCQAFQIGQQPGEIFLPAPRALQRLLNEGRAAIADGRFADGVAALGSILQEDSQDVPEDLRGQDFFIRPGLGEPMLSIKNRAIEELNQLPEEGRRSLEIQFGVRARQVLDEAIAKQDIEKIGSVARQFVHTEAGYDAMLLTAQYKQTMGYPLSAASILKNLLRYPAARQRFGVQLAQAATVCWLQSNNRSRAVATLEQAARDFAGDSLTINGQQIPIEKTDALLKALTADQSQTYFDRSTTSWLVTGGSPSRNATSKIGMPLPNVQWSWPIHSSRPEGMALIEAEETERKNGRLLLPKIELRMVGNSIISRSNDANIIGLNLETGLLTWQRPTSGSVAPLKNPAWEVGDNQLSKELKNRIWGSNSFGRISCDNQRCYHIVQKTGDLEQVRAMGLGYRYASSTTRLEGISIAGEGEILWSLGGDDSDEPALSSAFFLGPPLPFGGQLYCIVDINGQTELVVLDPPTGKLLWRQQLAANQVQIEFDQGRQAQGLTPSISDGVLVCPTGNGGIVAIDLLNRALSWGVSYATTTQARSNLNAGAFGANEYDPLDSRWFDESLVIEGGVVVVTPPETEFLICLDLLTGEEILRRPRGGASYVAGIHGKNLILVTGRSIQALDLEFALENRPKVDSTKRQNSTQLGGRSRIDPRAMASNVKVSWDTPFPDGLTLVGKGVWQEKSILLPLGSGRLVEIDLESGQIVNQTTVTQTLGNLFAHRDVLLTVGPTEITAFYTRKQLELAVRERLAKNSKDTWGLNHQAQLLLSEKKTKEAFKLLMDSYAIDSKDYETQFYLVDAMLVGLQEDFAYFSQYTAQMDSIVKSETNERIRYLQLLAKGLIEQSDHFGAIQRLWEIMSERRNALIQGAQTRNNQVQMDASLSVDLDAWFAVELGRLYQKCSPEQKAEIQRWVDTTLYKLRSTVITVRRQVQRHLLKLPAAETESLSLAESLLAFGSQGANDVRRNEQTNAEQILTTLVNSSNKAVADRARELLAKPTDSDASLPRIGDVKDGRWPEGRLVRIDEASDDGIYSIGRPIELIGNRFGRPTFTLANSDRLIFTDVNGKTISHLGYRQATGDLGGAILKAEVRGGLLILETTSELIAIDYYRRREQSQAILWRYSLDMASPRDQFSQPRMADLSGGPLGIPKVGRVKSDDRPHVSVGPLLTGAKIVQHSGTIIGLDPYTGRKLWAREGYGNDVVFAGSSEGNVLCIVSPAKAKTELIDSYDGMVVGQNNYLVQEMSERTRNRGKKRWEHWYSYGNWVVDYVEDGEYHMQLRVWNPREERTLLETRLPNAARVAQSQRNALAILNPTGQLQLLDLDSERLVKFDVPVDSDLDKINLLKFADQWVVLSNIQSVANRSLLNQSDLPASGYVYGINSKSMELQWKQPGRLYNVAVPQIQPRNSPYLVACRFNQGTPTATLVLIDLRTGKIAYAVDGPKLDRGTILSMELRPELHELALMIGEKFYRFKATDETPPPEPIVDFGSVFQREAQVKRDPASLFDQ